VIRDADLVERILKGTQPCKLKSLGGIAGSLDYNATNKLDVEFINLGSTRSEIEAALG
jgi:hypothetical protein